MSEPDWVDVCRVARRNGMAPLVFNHAARAGVLGFMPSDIVAMVKQDYCATFVACRRLARDTATIVGALAAGGVEALLLKGVCLAERLYGDIALRPVHDIDLVVRRSDLGRCIKTLEGLGYAAAPGSESQLSFRALNSLEMSYLGPGELHVEPHLELVRAPAYQQGLAVEAVWRRAEHITVEQAQARYLAPRDELRYLCVHLAAHADTRLLRLVDIALLADAKFGPTEWSTFVDETIAGHLATPVALALGQAHELLGASVPIGELERLRSAMKTWRERLGWSLAHAPNAHPARLAWHMLSLRGPNERLAYVLGAGKEGARKARAWLAPKLR
jgi:hypothetical protein